MRIAALLLTAILPPHQERKAVEPEIAVHSFQNAFGRHFSGEWQTWVLELENKLGRDLDLTIRVDDPSGRVQVSRRESLGRGARKRLFFYLPTAQFGYGTQAKYEILDPAGRKLRAAVATESLAVSDPTAYQIGLFSKDKSSSIAFGLPQEIAGRIQVATGRLAAATFPGRWAALSCLDAIILHDAPLDELSPEQAQALADYVRAGGTAVLSPGSDPAWLSHPVFKAFIPIRVRASERRTRMPLMNAMWGEFARPEPFLFHHVEGGRAMLWGREALLFDSGFGRVVVLPFDIRSRAFDGWGGLEKLWLDLVGQLPRRFTPVLPTTLPAASVEERMGLFHSMALLINPYPSFVLLVALAVLFLVTIGPVNYLVLRRLGMTLLIVVTVPAISLAFLGLVLGIGYVVKGTKTVAYSARFLATRSGLDSAREIQLFTLFSPSTRTYEITMAPGTYGLPVGSDRESRSREPGSDRIQCEDRGAFAYQAVSVGQWQSWSLDARAVRNLEGGVHFERRGNRVKISNLSPAAIERGLYVEAGEGAFASPFGAVGPGKTVEVEVDPTRLRPLEDLDIARESFAGRMLSPTVEFLQRARGAKIYGRAVPPVPEVNPKARVAAWLLCLLKEEAPTVTVDARLSGDSRSLTLLHVAERETP